MKKNISLAVVLAIAFSVTVINGCKKDDTAAPEISVTGSNPLTIILNTATNDPGATANDAEDGNVTVTSNWSTTNPNVNHTGSYTITYTATDKAGNSATETRTVNVVNIAAALAGSYVNAFDTCALTPGSHFDATVAVSETVNGRFTVTNFGAFGATINVDLNLQSDGTIVGVNLPESLGGGAQVDQIYTSNPPSAVISTSPVQFKVHYHWTDTGGNHDECTSTYSK